MSEKIKNLLKEAEASEDGKSSVTSARRELKSAEEAAEVFASLRKKLYDINRWEIDSGVTAFQLFNEDGNPLKSKQAGKGNFVRITLPGSGKNDWVKIIDIHDAANEVVISVQPIYDPTGGKEIDRDRTSHFFSSEASNNFCLQKEEAALSIYVIGLHEKPNTSESGGIVEAVRNVATASFGWLGFQKVEWKTFCENFLDNGKRKTDNGK
ncbi:MAG TPA: hypothetical protein VK400_03480 [Pyrinomonadaceae bacterium]|nr:hypothetical protein [Pyrinomonadaceae bacterium]